MKDIANRYKLLRGFRVHYSPGWDCHGMPIEQKALAEARVDDFTLSALELRKKGSFRIFLHLWNLLLFLSCHNEPRFCIFAAKCR